MSANSKAMVEREWVVTEKIKLTKKQLRALLRGEEVRIATGENIMGDTLCIQITAERKP